MDPNLEFFQPIRDHFNLLDYGLTELRYMDTLIPGVPYMYVTYKSHNGLSGTIPRTPKAPPSDMAATPAQRNLYIQKSQDIDIVTNTVDVIVYRNDENNPAANYIFFTEGNPKLPSNICALRNMLPAFEDRPEIEPDGTRQIDPETGRYKTVRPGSNPTHWPEREDNTLVLEQVINLIKIKSFK